MDDLWEVRTPARSWLDKASREQLDWLEQLTGLIVEKGTEPNWAAALDRFAETFGSDAAPDGATFRKHVRYLVAQRG